MSDAEITIPTGYELSRQWFDWAFENPSKVRPIHTAIYMFAVNHCNKLGWKKEFGLPTSLVMETLGIRSKNTYLTAFSDLINWGFLDMVEESKNQWSANIVAISKNDTTLYTAFDMATIRHSKQHLCGTVYGTDTIYKPRNNETRKPDKPEYDEFLEYWNLQNNCSCRMTDKKKKQINTRLETFSVEEIKKAIRNRATDTWINREGKKFKADWDSFWRNDEKVERYLNQDQTHQSVPAGFPSGGAQ